MFHWQSLEVGFRNSSTDSNKPYHCSVLPLLYNTAQCLLTRGRLLASIPPAARGFFNIHPNPVNGTVVAVFKSPIIDLYDVITHVRRCNASIDLQSLPHLESQGLGASWMRLIHAIGLEPQRKSRARRIIVDSSLDLAPAIVECGWKSLLILSLGLGVSPTDPTLVILSETAAEISEQRLHSTALRSESEERLIEVRWQEGNLRLELTKECSSWSVRRSLAYSLHMLTRDGGKREVLHFVSPTNSTGGGAFARKCDCKDIFLHPVDFGIFRDIDCAIFWTLYFEDVAHSHPRELLPIPQALLLLQFEITEELRQLSTGTITSRIEVLYPGDLTFVATIVSALTAIWQSAEHQRLLDELGSHRSNNPMKTLFKEPPRQRSNIQQIDDRRAFKTDKVADTSSEKRDDQNTTKMKADPYPILQASPTFESLSAVYRPSAATALAPIDAPIDLNDHSKPEAMLARLIIALSSMRHSTARNGWVSSIASGKVKYKVGADAMENKVGKLMAAKGRSCRIE